MAIIRHHRPSRSELDVSPTATVRVLVVDDNPDAADTLALLLELWRYDVRVAYNGHTGLTAAREWIPDCLISDIVMPGMDGYALAQALRADSTFAEMKLIALSAFSDREHARRADEVGFDHRITKATDGHELLEVMKMIEKIKEIADQTKELAKQNVELAGQTKVLLQEVKEEVKEVKHEVRELKKEVKDLKEERDGDPASK